MRDLCERSRILNGPSYYLAESAAPPRLQSVLKQVIHRFELHRTRCREDAGFCASSLSKTTGRLLSMLKLFKRYIILL